jgi:ribonucleotide monophosphatase NagD (HAD superfamily)
VVVVGGASEAVPWAVANRALRLALDGSPVVAMHGSLTWMTDQGLVMDMGVALVNALGAAGARVRVVGKPSLEIFVEAVGMLAVPARNAAMVGDDLANDVLAAQRTGMNGILVRTGKFRPDDLERTGERPDAVIDSVADLPDLLGLG